MLKIIVFSVVVCVLTFWNVSAQDSPRLSELEAAKIRIAQLELEKAQVDYESRARMIYQALVSPAAEKYRALRTVTCQKAGVPIESCAIDTEKLTVTVETKAPAKKSAEKPPEAKYP